MSRGVPATAAATGLRRGVVHFETALGRAPFLPHRSCACSAVPTARRRIVCSQTAGKRGQQRRTAKRGVPGAGDEWRISRLHAHTLLRIRGTCCHRIRDRGARPPVLRGAGALRWGRRLSTANHAVPSALCPPAPFVGTCNLSPAPPPSPPPPLHRPPIHSEIGRCLLAWSRLKTIARLVPLHPAALHHRCGDAPIPARPLRTASPRCGVASVRPSVMAPCFCGEDWVQSRSI